jgi:mono/diheme cytochrome c family protein
MKWHIALGTLAMAAVATLLVLIAAREPARMESFTRSFESRRVEDGALIFENNCRTCHGPQGEGIPGVAPAINSPELFNGERLSAIGFSGTVQDYLRGVIAAGRPIPSEGANYPQRMPTWGQEFGGPLRKDQVDSLVSFIMNWEDRALAASPASGVVAEGGEMVGTEITIGLPPGDAEEGRTLAASAQAGCSACHELAEVGPGWKGSGSMPGIGTRAGQRITALDYTGTAANPTEYLLESIVNSSAYVVEGYPDSLMPQDYGQRLTKQQAADLIAYMLTLE